MRTVFVFLLGLCFALIINKLILTPHVKTNSPIINSAYQNMLQSYFMSCDVPSEDNTKLPLQQAEDKNCANMFDKLYRYNFPKNDSENSTGSISSYISGRLEYLLTLSFNLRSKCTSIQGELSNSNECKNFYRRFTGELGTIGEELTCNQC